MVNMDIVKQNLETFGEEAVLWNAVEELGELVVAVSKMHRDDISRERALNDLLEEIGDCYIVMANLQQMYDVHCHDDDIRITVNDPNTIPLRADEAMVGHANSLSAYLGMLLDDCKSQLRLIIPSNELKSRINWVSYEILGLIKRYEFTEEQLSSMIDSKQKRQLIRIRKRHLMNEAPKLYEDKVSISDIAAMFCVSESTVRALIAQNLRERGKMDESDADIRPDAE